MSYTKKEKKKYCEIPFLQIMEMYNIPKYDKLCEGWFSLRRPLSYNRHLMAITGKRTTGKSTNTSLYVLLDFLLNGRGMVYSRRTEDETELTADSWFENAVTILNSYIENPDHRLIIEYTKHEYFVNGKLMGYAIPISLQHKRKSKNFSFCDWLIFDEFMAVEGVSYLGGKANPMLEYRRLMSLYQTMDRGIGKAHRNEVKIICLGNNETLFNPIFMAKGMDKFIRSDTRFLAPKGEEWMVMQLRPEDAPNAEDYIDTAQYKLSDERTREYAFENKSKEESGDKHFIEKITHPVRELANLHFDGVKMIMAIDNVGGFVYVKHGHKEGLKDYALTTADHRPNYVLTLTGGSEGYLATLKSFYNAGAIRFETGRCKYCIDNFYKYVI